MENTNLIHVLQFPEIKRCPHCHAEVDDDARFCSHCGQRIEKKARYTPQRTQTKIPLKTMADIEAMFSALATPERNTAGRIKIAERNSLMFVVGITTGLRSSDIIRLTAKTFNSAVNNRIYVIEKKTGKGRTIAVHESVMEKVKEYMRKYHIIGDDLLFPSQKGGLMERHCLNEIIVDTAKKLGWDPILYGSHTLRKTYAYQFYTKANTLSRENGYRALSILCKELHHSSEAITLAYIGIDEEEIRAICDLTTEQYAELISRMKFEEESE